MGKAGSQPQSPVDPVLRRRGLGQLYWIRVGLAGVAGVVSVALGFTKPSNAVFGILIAIALYALSYWIAKQMLEIPLGNQEKHKIVTQGIGSFVIFFLFVWILLTTIASAL